MVDIPVMMPHTVIDWIRSDDPELFGRIISTPCEGELAEVVARVRGQSGNLHDALIPIGLFGDGVPHQRLCARPTQICMVFLCAARKNTAYFQDARTTILM